MAFEGHVRLWWSVIGLKEEKVYLVSPSQDLSHSFYTSPLQCSVSSVITAEKAYIVLNADLCLLLGIAKRTIKALLSLLGFTKGSY